MAQLNSLIVTGDSRFLNTINGDITGDAGTVNGHTVNSNVPNNAVFTDTKVTQTADDSTASNFEILFSNTADNTTRTESSKKSSKLLYNPSTGTIQGNRVSASKVFKNIITGTGTVAQDKGSGVSPRYFPAKWTFNTGLTATDGDIITIKIPVAGHDYGVFMSIDNGTNYYPIVGNSTGRITTHYPVNNYITVVFEPGGSAASMFPLNGGDARVTVSNGVWRVINYYDSNSNDTGYYLRRIYPNIKAGSNKIFPYTLIMQLSDGRWESIVTSSSTGTSKARNTHGFLLTNLLLMYANATYNENAAVGTYNIWHENTGLIDHRYSFNTANDSTNGTTGYKPVYIVGSLGSDGLFYLDTKWWTQTLPSSEDGKLYIYIGDAYDYYRMTFVTTQKIYYYKQGAIREFTQHSATTNYAIGGMDPLCIPGTNITAEGTNTWPSGNNAHAEGYQTSASGDYSHAEGYKTCASGAYSHSEGAETYARVTSSHAEGSATSAYGNYSHTEGERTIANGSHSHSEGYMTTALVAYSHAEGASNFAGGQYSHAEGHNTCALGDSSHAEGYQTYARGDIGNHAEGKNTRATGYASHAEGSDTSANGYYSHAEGFSTIASGYYSHAEGNHTCASGNSSHAEGNGTCASGNSQHVEGKYNVADNNMALIIGGGTSASKRKNIFTVSWDGDVTAGRSNGIDNTNKLITGADLYNEFTSASTTMPLNDLLVHIDNDSKFRTVDYTAGIPTSKGLLYRTDSENLICNCINGWKLGGISRGMQPTHFGFRWKKTPIQTGFSFLLFVSGSIHYIRVNTDTTTGAVTGQEIYKVVGASNQSITLSSSGSVTDVVLGECYYIQFNLLPNTNWTFVKYMLNSYQTEQLQTKNLYFWVVDKNSNIFEYDKWYSLEQ